MWTDHVKHLCLEFDTMKLPKTTAMVIPIKKFYRTNIEKKKKILVFFQERALKSTCSYSACKSKGKEDFYPNNLKEQFALYKTFYL